MIAKELIKQKTAEFLKIKDLFDKINLTNLDLHKKFPPTTDSSVDTLKAMEDKFFIDLIGWMDTMYKTKHNFINFIRSKYRADFRLPPKFCLKHVDGKYTYCERTTPDKEKDFYIATKAYSYFSKECRKEGRKHLRRMCDCDFDQLNSEFKNFSTKIRNAQHICARPFQEGHENFIDNKKNIITDTKEVMEKIKKTLNILMLIVCDEEIVFNSIYYEDTQTSC